MVTYVRDVSDCSILHGLACTVADCDANAAVPSPLSRTVDTAIRCVSCSYKDKYPVPHRCPYCCGYYTTTLFLTYYQRQCHYRCCPYSPSLSWTKQCTQKPTILFNSSYKESFVRQRGDAHKSWAFRHTHRPQSSPFWGFPYRILNMNTKKELRWGLWVAILARRELMRSKGKRTNRCEP